ncbi:elongation factor tu [Pectobacterium parmentieri]|uniref:Elongation factor tu n=2 Tax=Pectobacterium TaxID=122277 RepID=A0A8B3FJ38_PECPM|nr:elongation factor tu [Pectobacterium parmentieri]RYC36933.1 elongation factor tu [Pectobacterium zantedeschiae]AYH08024.1 elongation factor tu [Pectobacterium parmentieri]AYH12498.1 elongation factor tu [Pectobacterium parmentieri]AYH16776.1 elongation factor tu [Pectobacterium parmentieri]
MITFDATRDKRASFDALFLRCHGRTYLISDCAV